MRPLSTRAAWRIHLATRPLPSGGRPFLWSGSGFPFKRGIPEDISRSAIFRSFGPQYDFSEDERRISWIAYPAFVANAGIALDGFDIDVARRTIDVNFYGAMRSTDKLLPLPRPGARIVMVSSGMGELSCLGPELREPFAAPNLNRATLVGLVERFVSEVAAGTHAKSGFPSSAYRVSKVALNAYVSILARELASDPRRIFPDQRAVPF